ncbi:MAG TPA: hypothetical protein VFB42_03680 [Gaiellaceae bacterium]|nr:hypothetical protein [Gaiellaceae bacterium]
MSRGRRPLGSNVVPALDADLVLDLALCESQPARREPRGGSVYRRLLIRDAH